ncbi:MAG TPA: PspC domain-containing protein [candidate division Zixibacteria bacterium]
MENRLYRSKKDSVIAGVCGGLGEYFGIDPVILRIVAVILVLASGIGLLAYIIAWIAIPQRKDEEEAITVEKKCEANKYLPGIILVVVGLVFLLNNILPWFRFDIIWPLVLVVLGIAILLKTSGGGK